jgi:prolyl-tRNA synthetase
VPLSSSFRHSDHSRAILGSPVQQWLARGGFVRSLAPHTVSLLPLGAKTRRQIEGYVRSAFESAGAQEIQLPSDLSELQPEPVRPGPDDIVDAHTPDDLDLAALRASVRGILQSYKQLPIWLFQVCESRSDAIPGSTGLLATREGRAAELYGLHAGADAVRAAYPDQLALAGDIFLRCGMETRTIVAEVDAAGQPVAHALVLPLGAGEPSVICCPVCGYAAYQTAARCGHGQIETEPLLPMEEIATPDCKTIVELARFLCIPTSRTAKAVFLATQPGLAQLIVAVVRGDTDLDETKLRRVLGLAATTPAADGQIRRAGMEPGYGSPVGVSGVTVVVDALVAQSPNLVAGANCPGMHLRNVNPGRDYRPTLVADIALVKAGEPCPQCGEALEFQAAAELARVHIEDDSITRTMGVTYLDQVGASRPLSVSRTRIYLDRLMGALAESCHDGRGLFWPTGIAPFDVYLMTAGKALPEVTIAADRLYEQLTAQGFEVLYDDRDERAGVKFNDADLLGIPIRVVVGERSLREGMAEIKPRIAAEAEAVPLDALPARLATLLGITSRPV